MSAVIPLSSLLDARRVWRGRATPIPAGDQPTGWAALDAVLPSGGWPAASLSEVLLPVDGVGELRVVLPTLARLTQAGKQVVVVAPPYAPYVTGWRQHGVAMHRVEIVAAQDRDVLWATEQCLRSGSCAAVLAWPTQADAGALRRLQVAADTGKALAFIFRDRKHLSHASPSPLRLELEAQPHHQLWVRKCRGGAVPAHPIPLACALH